MMNSILNGNKQTLFFFLVSFHCVPDIQGVRDIECLEELSSIGTSLLLKFPQSSEWPESSSSDILTNPTLWFKPQTADFPKSQSIVWKFGQMDSSNTFLAEFELQLKRGNKFLIYLFKKIQGRKVYFESRVPLNWINAQNWTQFILSDSSFSIQLGRSLNETLEIQLDGFEIGKIDAVKYEGNKDVFASVNCTVAADVASSSTTETTLASTTTTTNETLVAETTNLDTTTGTLVADTTISLIAEMKNSSDIYENSTVDSITNDSNSSEKLFEDDVEPIPVKPNVDECTSLPLWVWICIGVMITFVLLSFILLTCIFILLRKHQNCKSSDDQKDALRGSLTSHGGYGQKAQDLNFFKPGEEGDNIMVIAPKSSASYTQTLQLPHGNEMAQEIRFLTGSRESKYRRSISCPGPNDSTPSFIIPPPPSTPPPHARHETVPSYSPNGSNDNTCNRKRSYSKGRISTSSRRQTPKDEDADDESSLSN